MFTWLERFLHARQNTGVISLRRPAYIRRNADSRIFYRQPNGMYEYIGEEYEYLRMTLVQGILTGKIPGYTVSSHEAPDFHISYVERSLGQETGTHAGK